MRQAESSKGQRAGGKLPVVKSKHGRRKCANATTVVLFVFCHFFLVSFLALAQTGHAPGPIELLRKGRVEEARKLLMEALHRDPDNEQTNALLGQIAFSRKEYAQAVARFEKSPTV